MSPHAPAPAQNGPHCPQCQQPGVPIAYGYPGPEMIDAAQKGEIRLGGCMVRPDAPTHVCANGHGWSDTEARQPSSTPQAEFGGNWNDEPPF